MSRLVECTHCGAFVTEGAGHTLLDCVGHLRQAGRSIYAAGYTGVLQREITDLRDALAHERDRARRVVRVFWRVRGYTCEYGSLRDCRRLHVGPWGKVHRVVVRRVAKKAAT